jgi:hypothetical protein
VAAGGRTRASSTWLCSVSSMALGVLVHADAGVRMCVASRGVACKRHNGCCCTPSPPLPRTTHRPQATAAWGCSTARLCLALWVARAQSCLSTPPRPSGLQRQRTCS